jgi:hypothetical protein
MSDAETAREKMCGYCRAVPAALACDDYREATPCLIRRLQSFIYQDIKNRDHFYAELKKANARADAAQALLTETRTKALEEAAAIAEACWPVSDDPSDQPAAGIRVDAALTIAAAIRAKVGSGGDNTP